MAATVSIAVPASADADDPAVYEVVSYTVSVVDVTYFDCRDYQRAEQVSLPWTTEVHAGDLTSAATSTNRAEVRANWRVEPRRRGSVTARIRYQGKVLIENTRDHGEVGCSTSTFSFHWG
jgi:hypothetical protein